MEKERVKQLAKDKAGSIVSELERKLIMIAGADAKARAESLRKTYGKKIIYALCGIGGEGDDEFKKAFADGDDDARQEMANAIKELLIEVYPILNATYIIGEIAGGEDEEEAEIDLNEVKSLVKNLADLKIELGDLVEKSKEIKDFLVLLSQILNKIIYLIDNESKWDQDKINKTINGIEQSCAKISEEEIEDVLVGDGKSSLVDKATGLSKSVKTFISKYKQHRIVVEPTHASPTVVGLLDPAVEHWLKNEDTRPAERRDWKPWDYIKEAVRQIKPPGVAALPNGVDLRGEYNNLVSSHPEYKKDELYWRTVLSTWNVLYKADPPSGSNDFSVNFEKWKTEGFQTSGFDTEHASQILKHKDYGDISMRIMALLEIIMSDDSFSYDGICKPGQFIARKMDKKSSELREAIKKIVEQEKWIEKYGIPADANIVDVVFNMANALDMRGHFFLDDTAASVTKGFGGEDFTWLSRPEATVGYDINRYSREPKASWYLMAAVDLSNSWHERVTFNELVSTSSSGFYIPDGTKDKEGESPDKAAERKSAEKEQRRKLISFYSNKYGVSLSVADTQFEKLDWDHKYEIISKYLKEGGISEARIKNGEKQTEIVREWFNILVSPEDVEECMRRATSISADDDSPFDLEALRHGEFVFRDKGATFPTVYQFYVSQMITGRPKDGRIASLGITKDNIFDPDFDPKNKFKNLAPGRTNNSESGFQTYLVAQEGWLKVLDMIKSAPKPLNSDTLLRSVDTFLSELGKAKIVNGAHHNLMNTLSFLFLVKQFKFLEPRSYSEYRRTRNLALKKVADQDTSKSGGGIPAHVKSYMVWLLGDAKSVSRSYDQPGDLLRPLDPTIGELMHDEVHESTHGMEEGFMKSWVGLWASVEAAMTGMEAPKKGEDKAHVVKIPLGHIKWEDQDTSTKK